MADDGRTGASVSILAKAYGLLRLKKSSLGAVRFSFHVSRGVGAASATRRIVAKSELWLLIQPLLKAPPQPNERERSLPVPSGMMATAGAGVMLLRMIVCTQVLKQV